MARTKPNTQRAGRVPEWIWLNNKENERLIDYLYTISVLHKTQRESGNEREGEWVKDIDRLRKWNCGKKKERMVFALTLFEHGKVHVIDLKFPKNMNNRQKWNCTYNNIKRLSHTVAVFFEKFGSSSKSGCESAEHILHVKYIRFSNHGK